MDSTKTSVTGLIQQVHIDALTVLAAAAIPFSEKEWGSERQVNAENEFHDAFDRVTGLDTIESIGSLHSWMQMATIEERIALLIRIAKSLVTAEYCVSWPCGYGDVEPEHGIRWFELHQDRWGMEEILEDIAMLKVGETFTYEVMAERVVFYRSK